MELSTKEGRTDPPYRMPSLTVSVKCDNLAEYQSFTPEIVRVMAVWSQRHPGKCKHFTVVLALKETPEKEAYISAVSNPYLGDELLKHAIQPFVLCMPLHASSRLVMLMMYQDGRRQRINING